MPLDLPPIPEIPPEVDAFTKEWIAYRTGEKRLHLAHLVVTLCRFGRWLSWALLPWWRFFPTWTDSKPGDLSVEQKAELSLKKPVSVWEAMLPMMFPVAAGLIVGVQRLGRKRVWRGRAS